MNKLSKALSNRLEHLKEHNEIKTSNYTAVISYRKLEQLGYCTVTPETMIHENKYIFSIILKDMV